MLPIYCSINSIREEVLQAMTETDKSKNEEDREKDIVISNLEAKSHHSEAKVAPGGVCCIESLVNYVMTYKKMYMLQKYVPKPVFLFLSNFQTLILLNELILRSLNESKICIVYMYHFSDSPF